MWAWCPLTGRLLKGCSPGVVSQSHGTGTWGFACLSSMEDKRRLPPAPPRARLATVLISRRHHLPCCLLLNSVKTKSYMTSASRGLSALWSISLWLLPHPTRGPGARSRGAVRVLWGTSGSGPARPSISPWGPLPGADTSPPLPPSATVPGPTQPVGARSPLRAASECSHTHCSCVIAFSADLGGAGCGR